MEGKKDTRYSNYHGRNGKEACIRTHRAYVFAWRTVPLASKSWICISSSAQTVVEFAILEKDDINHHPNRLPPELTPSYRPWQPKFFGMMFAPQRHAGQTRQWVWHSVSTAGSFGSVPYEGKHVSCWIWTWMWHNPADSLAVPYLVVGSAGRKAISRPMISVVCSAGTTISCSKTRNDSCIRNATKLKGLLQRCNSSRVAFRDICTTAAASGGIGAKMCASFPKTAADKDKVSAARHFQIPCRSRYG
ncbi:hypothetical protein QBC40DRAFT_40907 [Triangularia verruculosa]|uniref:Uncharacterized protein n=1 Tax=Triangularia verruculosa TaxID=2587418 RepID=A0AAN6XLK3_9PEZI|nr:hypothetical protein QBC40DRAFT_40907 [Triangularia verruculosa]